MSLESKYRKFQQNMPYSFYVLYLEEIVVSTKLVMDTKCNANTQ